MDRRSILLGRRPTPAAHSVAPAAAVAAHAAPLEVPYAGGLAPFAPSASEPWDARRARHLLRRATLSAPSAAVAAALTRTPAQTVDALVDAALAAGLPPTPDYATLFPPVNPTAEQTTAYNRANSAAYLAEVQSVMRELLGLRAAGTPLTERMALLWHTVIPTSRSSYNQASRLVEYWTVLRRNALGSFETLIREVGTTQAMLNYLNGKDNRVGRPNENYGREVLELFTLGVTGPDGSPNYTQADITDLSRALTGWQTPNQQVEAVFNPARYDAGQKTIFGRTGAFGYAEAHDVLFAERQTQIAHHAAQAVYQAFVAATPNTQVVAEMAGVLTANGFQIGAAVRALLKSAHFFSAGALGARIKDPLALTLGLVGELGWTNPEALSTRIRNLCRDIGFDLFYPPDVSGWDEGRTWLDTGSVPLRGIATDQLIAQRTEARAYAATFASAQDPYRFVADVAERLVAVPLSPATLAEAVTILLAGIPDYEWSPTVASAEGRIRGLLQFLARLPEYHLA